MYQVGAVIVAAGLSSRMGKFKPMLPWGESSVIKEIIKKFQAAGVKKIVVVTGYRSEELEQHLADSGVECVKNEYYNKSQMFDSAKIGFSELIGLCEKIFFMPTDIPLFQVETIKALIESKAELICPSWQKKKGHPLMFSNRLMTFFVHYNGERGLHGAIEASGVKLQYLEVEDWGILHDMDTMRDYERLQKIEKEYQ